MDILPANISSLCFKNRVFLNKPTGKISSKENCNRKQIKFITSK